MSDMTVVWVLIGNVIGIVVGYLIFVLFDIYRLNKRLKKQKIELEKYQATGGSSFVVSMSRAFSELQMKNLKNQAKRDDKAY
ncbi:hypothetical protein [Psychrobacter immobilis]|uniref:hypothetical protein n=1 Tax=Psychrobacter immobilis TaxID=498 RepID=UPI003FCFD0C0